jgi:soluble lytic murein transglycosylase
MNRRLSSATLLTVAVALVWYAAGRARAQEQPVESERRLPSVPRLAPTAHPPLPGHPSLYWLLPELSATRSVVGRGDDPSTRFARGVKLIADKQFAAGLPLVNGTVATTPLAAYGQYYTARALFGVGRVAEADALLAALSARKPEGFLREAGQVQLSDIALARGEPARAIDILEDLADEKVTSPEDVLLRLGHAAEVAGHTEKALQAYRRIYYEYPLSEQAGDAQAGIERLETPALVTPDRFKRQLTRAERLFSARRWAQARAAFEPLGRAATSTDDRELITLRLAECDYYLDRPRTARDALRPYLDDSSRKAEARFFFLTAARALDDTETYLSMARRMSVDFPDSSWTEETLNNLASHYLVSDEDAAADQVFRELAQRFPQSRYAERAAWKIGWWAYKNGQFAEAAQTFEAAASRFPRADNRPAWLYWSGRARDQLGDQVTANSRYRLAYIDYLNSYYGRLSAKVLAQRREAPIQDSVRTDPTPMPAPLIPTDAIVRQLVGLGLYDDALKELQYAQQSWGDSPAVQATIAWIRHEQGLDQRAMERFQNLRGAITLMKRAYPQYLAAGGEDLPPEVLRVMFPLDYWPLIRKYSERHDLDPYLMAALIAQESTFTADIRSAANAYGLMQLVPDAGRQYARKVGLRYSLRLLTQPEANIRMGMAYFKDLSMRFGGDHYALASYNAGPHRVARWISERPAAVQDEFIDDIPFPETQNYVKRILGTAEDYRRLYGSGILQPIARASAVAAPKAGVKKAPARKAPRRPARRR